MKILFSLIIFSLSLTAFAQDKADTIVADSTIDYESLTRAAIIDYTQEFLGRNSTFEPTFQFDSLNKIMKISEYRDSLWPADSVRKDTTIAHFLLNYSIESGGSKVDEITFTVTPDYKVLDTGLLKLNYLMQLANKELTSLTDAKEKVNGEYPDAIWKSIKLKRGKITHYAHKGYKVGDFLTYYYFDGICKTCSYQIIKLQFDAETGKIASELKIKTD